MPRTDPVLHLRPVLVVVAIQTAVLAAMSPFYGPHRDELYFVAAGRHLAWGYPDQGWLTPVLARLSTEVAPGNLVVLRLWPLLFAACLTLVAARFAALGGGGRGAQTLAAACTAFGAVTMANGHRLSTATFDILVWALLLLLVAEALVRDRPRLWVAAGLVAGLGLSNKALVLALLGALLVACLADGAARRQLATPWPWAGAAAALVVWLPNLLWQASRGWPQAALAADIRDEYGGLGGRAELVGQALLMYSPLLAVVWVWGLVALLRRERWAALRPVGVAFLLVLVAFLVAGGKGYYLAGAIVPLLAVGCVEVAERWPGRRLVVAGAVLVGSAVVAWPGVVPAVPVSVYAGSVWRVVDDDQAETVGWPTYTAQVQAVLENLPADRRESAVVLTQNYGQAGALEWYGTRAPVYSVHNGYADWGPPSGTGAVVAVGPRTLTAALEGCELADTLVDRDGVDNEEAGTEVWVCDGPRRPWAELWPELRRLSA